MATSSPIFANWGNPKIQKYVSEYRKSRDNLRQRRTSFYDTFTQEYFHLMDAPHVHQLLSIDGQQYCYNLATWYIIFATYCGVKWPEYWHWVYAISILPLLVLRYITYRKLHYYPFCFDFCYWLNYLCIVALFTEIPMLLAAAQTLSFSVLLAVVMWNNSLVLHSIDKITSVMIHIMPAFSLHIYHHIVLPKRYEQYVVLSSISTDTTLLSSLIPPEVTLFPSWSWKYHVVAGLVYYLIWQGGYSLCFDYLNADLFDQDPLLTSSIHHFAQNVDRYPLAQRLQQFARTIGWFTPTQVFVAKEWKTLAVFYAFQLFYTILTVPIGWVMYYSPLFSCLCIIAMFGHAVNGGAKFYLSSTYIKAQMHSLFEQLEHAEHQGKAVPPAQQRRLGELQREMEAILTKYHAAAHTSPQSHVVESSSPSVSPPQHEESYCGSDDLDNDTTKID